MKSYSDKKFEETLEGKFKIEIINENLLTDFLKVAKHKFFDKNIFISSKDANELKIIFSESFINNFSTGLKFKMFSLSNLIYKPSDVIKTIQKKLLQLLKEEIDAMSRLKSSGNLFHLVNPESGYSKNTSLLSECYEIVDNLENWIKRNLEKCLIETYQLNSVSIKSQSSQRFIKSFKQIFLRIFSSLSKKKFRFDMSLDDFSTRNEFSALAYKIFKKLKKINSGLDIANTYVNDELYNNTTNDQKDDKMSDEQIDEMITKLTSTQLHNSIREYGRKYKVSILTSEILHYIDVYKIAYRQAIIRNKSLKTPNQSQVLEIMHEYLESLQSDKKEKNDDNILKSEESKV